MIDLENKTKIIATVGPATSSKEMLRELIIQGVNVFRLNFSHGAHDVMEQVIGNIRELNRELRHHTAILADLQGPKIRIGEVENNRVDLVGGQEITFTTKPCVGNGKVLYINYGDFPKDVEVGEKILIDDGKLMLEIVNTNRIDEVKARVVHGGVLSSKKGVNLPNTRLSLPCLTEKDRKDLEFILEHKISWLALSFVRSAEDIRELRRIIKRKKKKKVTKIVAKIEKPEAVADIDEIIMEADGLMVARGDLGVEIPMENVPLVQKDIVRKCHRASKPVIIATQMMESMITNISPTRAEVNDVANAVLDGADAVMLSGETSVGKFPIDVIKAMYKIILRVEEFGGIYNLDFDAISTPERKITDAICESAVRLSETAEAKAIVTMSFSGYTGFKLASYRPRSWVYVFTSNYRILNMLSLIWGVKGFYYDKFVSTDHTIDDIKYILRKDGFLKEGDIVINIASMPISDKGMANMVRLSEVN